MKLAQGQDRFPVAFLVGSGSRGSGVPRSITIRSLARARAVPSAKATHSTDSEQVGKALLTRDGED